MGKEQDKSLWGGRFREPMNARFAAFNRSFAVDVRLFTADVRGSLGHLAGLSAAGVLEAAEVAALEKALNELLTESGVEGFFDAALKDPNVEDVHSFLESQLVKKCGDAGKKLHLGRSRNDQVATAFRIWLKDESDALVRGLRSLQGALLRLADQHADAVLPGYTHLQRGQPVLWAHWCLAYGEMLDRDAARLQDARRRCDTMPLGSGALAGSSQPIDRLAMAKALGFSAVTRNSLDAVSDRDFAIEFLSAASISMMHLSRMAEDLILYASSEFGFIELGDAVATGSSLMPQKKNPDGLELVRGKTGRVYGALMGLLTTMKALPLAYNKDMQEDKEAVFDAADTWAGCLEVSAIVLGNIKLTGERSRAAAGSGGLNATELADYLVRKGLPFRVAHEAAGKLVLEALGQGVELEDLPLETFQRLEPGVEKDVFTALSLESTLASKGALGGTAPAQVKEALKKARELWKS
jgi:argininosuccinate lyase